MKRREFVIGLGGTAAAVVSGFTATAQQNEAPVIGFMHPSRASRAHEVVAAFEDGLRESGFVIGKNVELEYAWANDDYARLPEIVRDLSRRNVSLIFAGTPVAALAAKRARLSIPIVFCVGSDPVIDGIVASMNEPGQNITGTTFFADLLGGKRLALLRDLIGSKLIAVLINPRNANAELEERDAREAGRSLQVQLLITKASSETEIVEAFTEIREKWAAGLLVASDAFLNFRAQEIATLSIRYGLATCFSYREPVQAGGLMSYGASRTNAYREAGHYAARILRGEKAGNLPVQQATKFDLVLNLRTAKALGLSLPASMQLLADEVIE